MEIRSAEKLALRGPSGAGKSTLLNLIGAIEKPTSGEIIVNGQPLGTLGSLHRYRADSIGFIFQFHHLLPHLTARENVEIPLIRHAWSGRYRRSRATELLESVGVGDHRDRMPGQLSGGERQRVAIARALANEPSVILADEPTGSLDSDSAAHVLRLLLDYSDRLQATLIVATHNESVARAMSRSLFMEFGRIVEPVAT